jgi:hypothetical protein
VYHGLAIETTKPVIPSLVLTQGFVVAFSMRMRDE